MQKIQDLPSASLVHLFEDQANTYCFQCGKQSKQWTDLAHGVFLCLSCAALFKQLTWVVQVKSVGLDFWTKEEVQRMQRGGNTNFRIFLTFYGLENAEIRIKLTSKAAAHYRGVLDGKQMGNQPTAEKGRQIYKEDIPIADMSAEEIFETAKEKAFYLGGKTKSLGEKGIKKLQEKYQSGQLKEGAKKVATSVATGAKWLWGAFKEKATEIVQDIKK